MKITKIQSREDADRAGLPELQHEWCISKSKTSGEEFDIETADRLLGAYLVNGPFYLIESDGIHCMYHPGTDTCLDVMNNEIEIDESLKASIWNDSKQPTGSLT